jgi:hypothetical protein
VAGIFQTGHSMSSCHRSWPSLRATTQLARTMKMSTASLSAAAAVPANLGDIPRQLLWDPASARAQSDTRSAARRHPPSVRLRANIGRAARQGLRQSAAALPCCLLQATAVGLHVWLHAMRVASNSSSSCRPPPRRRRRPRSEIAGPFDEIWVSFGSRYEKRRHGVAGYWVPIPIAS